MKCSNLRHSLSAHRTKDWAITKEELAGYRLAPPTTGGREAVRARSKGQSRPELGSSTKLWADTQLVTKSSWDPGQLTSSRRVAAWDELPRRDTWHTWDDTHLGNQATGTREEIKTHSPHGTVPLPSIWSLELLRPGKGTKLMPNQVCTFVEKLRNKLTA